MSSRTNYRRLLTEQRKWIEEHGGDLPGYIHRYGDPGINTAEGRPMYGEGGTKIYAADMQELHRIEQRLK